MFSVQVGNAGEYYVMACLLTRGDLAVLAAGGNPHLNILVGTPSGDFRPRPPIHRPTAAPHLGLNPPARTCRRRAGTRRGGGRPRGRS